MAPGFLDAVEKCHLCIFTFFLKTVKFYAVDKTEINENKCKTRLFYSTVKKARRKRSNENQTCITLFIFMSICTIASDKYI